ncbi:MAG: class I SAM-dependent methyltransferase, partial [Armatimonadetes bacterium]|nr:class I SAM-dependent methyltransferase [Armatimonadota bacterium]
MDAWELRYWADECAKGREPTPFLMENLGFVRRGRALDVAMGEGRNAIFLAENGFEVTGIDISETAVTHAREWSARWNVNIDSQVADLESIELPENTYDLVVVVHYLQRSLFEQIIRTLKPGGMLIYETYTEDHVKYRPMRPDYLLKRNELLRAFSPLYVMLYREIDTPQKERAVA